MSYNSPWSDPYWYYMQQREREEEEYEEYEEEYDDSYAEYQEEVYEVEDFQPQERSIDEINAELDLVIRDLKRQVREKEAAIKAEKKAALKAEKQRAREAKRKPSSSKRKKKIAASDDTSSVTTCSVNPSEPCAPKKQTVKQSSGSQTFGCISWLVAIALWVWVIFFM